MMMESSRCSFSTLGPHDNVLPPSVVHNPLPGLNLDSFSGLPFVKGDVTGSRSQSATFL